MLFEKQPLDTLPPIQESIPPAPAFDPNLKSEVFLDREASGVGGVADSELTDRKPLPLPPLGDLEPAPAGGAGAPAQVGERGGHPARSAEPAARPKETPKPQSRAESPVQSEARPAAGSVPGSVQGSVQGSVPGSVQGAAQTQPAKPGGAGLPAYAIQVASVATQEAAAELEGRLRKGGYTAFVEKAEVNGKLYYRVRVGPELDRARAEKSAAQLRERYKVETLIKSYP
jgi:DedD protein